ncbi:MAG: hypothetical protein IJ640_00345 [Prevotella sp.]|nr:hypothetical protein [Paludibacteraceae bacterium]MBR1525095.1 hypothetical protein [Prevotella sp.]
MEKYNEWLCTGTLNAATKATRQMYLDIFSRYQDRLSANNGIEFKYSLMQDILESPAPSFYITPSSAAAFYYRAMAYKRTLSKK